MFIEDIASQKEPIASSKLCLSDFLVSTLSKPEIKFPSAAEYCPKLSQ
jgi:hypothetical protein